MKRFGILGFLLAIGLGVGLCLTQPTPQTEGESLQSITKQIHDEHLFEKANAQRLTPEETRRLHERLGRYDAINAARAAKLLARIQGET